MMKRILPFLRAYQIFIFRHWSSSIRIHILIRIIRTISIWRQRRILAPQRIHLYEPPDIWIIRSMPEIIQVTLLIPLLAGELVLIPRSDGVLITAEGIVIPRLSGRS